MNKYTPKEYVICDFVVSSDNVLSEDTIYVWDINGDRASGTVSDFVESMGKYNKYCFTCKRCGIQTRKQGVSVLNKGLLCVKCSRDIPSYNLGDLYPYLNNMYDTSKNTEKLCNIFKTDDKNWYWFKCDEGHSFRAHIKGVIESKQRGHGCPICYKNDNVSNHNVLIEYPEVAKLWDYTKNSLKPEEVSYGAIEGYWFVCGEGHSFNSTISHMKRSINSKFKGCPYCSKKVFTADRSVLYNYPWIKDYWDFDKNSTPLEDVRVYSTRKFWFKCVNGHSFLSDVETVYTSKAVSRGCPVCTGRVVERGINDLNYLYPELVKNRWSYVYNDISPCDVTPYSSYKAWWLCSECGSPFQREVNSVVRGKCICLSCINTRVVSSEELELYNEVLRVFPNAISQYAVDRKVYDIYVPEVNMLVDFNGVYYHNELFHSDVNYHYNRYITAKENGYSLYVIWEDDWRRNKDLCLRGLYSKLGVLAVKKVNARECMVKESSFSSGILDRYHIQGNAPIGCRYLQLIEGSEVVSELAYRWDNGFINIVRFASIYNVRGGFTKLLKRLKLLNPEGVYTFSDNAVSDGCLYSKNGFKLDSELKPDYFYVYNGERKHKFNFRIERFLSDENLIYEEGLSEHDLALKNKIYRIYDYGKKKWILYID